MKPAWLEQVRSELADNPRLRLGIVVVGVLLLLYQLAGLSELRARLEDRYTQNQTQLLRVRGISSEDGWDKRASEVATMRRALEAEIPQADSIGLAQATMQGWIGDLAASTGQKLTISMGTPSRMTDGSDYWRVPAQVSGQVPITRALELLRQIESRKELTTVQSIRLSNGDRPVLALELVSYYKVPAAENTDAAP